MAGLTYTDLCRLRRALRISARVERELAPLHPGAGEASLELARRLDAPASAVLLANFWDDDDREHTCELRVEVSE